MNVRRLQAAFTARKNTDMGDKASAQFQGQGRLARGQTAYRAKCLKEHRRLQNESAIDLSTVDCKRLLQCWKSEGNVDLPGTGGNHLSIQVL
jgi:hypothetical protein